MRPFHSERVPVFGRNGVFIMVNNFLKAAAVSAVAIFGAGAASAATTMEEVDFDDLGNSGNKAGNPYISNGGFYFDPTNVNNDNKCEGSGGKCLGQDNSTGPNSITSITLGQDPFSASLPGDGLFDENTNPDGTKWGEYTSFNLISFYFALVGNNADIIVEGVFGDGTTTKRQYTVDDSTSNGDFAVGEVTFAEPFNGAAAGDNVDQLEKASGNNGPFYYANLGQNFMDVKKIFFYSDQNSNLRLDCVKLSGELTGTPQSSSCGTTMTPVPLPAAGWMLLAGVGGLAAMRRRKKKS